MAGPHLSLADLEAHDPTARPWGEGRRARYCCPLPECEGKKVNAAHRTLTVYPEGGWTCARCKAKGKLTDTWIDRPFTPRRPIDRRAAAFVRTPATPRSPEPPTEDRRYDFASEIREVERIEGTPAAAYLEARGIPPAVAHACGVRFSPAFGSSIAYDRKDGTKGTAKGGPAAVFPIRDEAGKVSGAQGRHAGQGGYWKDGPSKLTFKAPGVEEMGVFVTPGAFDAAAVVVVEAPIDALTLHLCGVPAIATVGTSCPTWLLGRLKLRRVVLAHDADEAGDKAARTIADELAKYGAFCVRLRPSGAKDWNELLAHHGLSSLRDALSRDFPSARIDPFEDPGSEPEPPAAELPEPEDWRAPARIGGREYERMSLRDKWEACAAAGLPSSPKMRELLKMKDWTGTTMTHAVSLQAQVEDEARRS